MATEVWVRDFEKENISEANLSSILKWFDKSSNKALNPARLIGLDTYVKPLFSYIIRGLIDSKPDISDNTLSDIVTALKSYYNKLSEDQKNDELVIFDLMVKATELLEQSTLFFIDEKQGPEERLINYLVDFKGHFSEQILTKLDFYEYVGIKSKASDPTPVNSMNFIISLRKIITEHELDELNKLLELYEEDTLNIKNKFKYQNHRALVLVRLVNTMINHLHININNYISLNAVDTFKNFRQKMEVIMEFILFLKANYYTLLNTKEFAPPAELFHGFHNYIIQNSPIVQMPAVIDESNIEMLIVDSNKTLELLSMYFRKIEIMLNHSEISEIKTQECAYDLFDLIELDNSKTNSNNSAMNVDKNVYPVRTINFRRDFILVNDTITIDKFKISKQLFLDIDRYYCYPKKIPLSLFLGILSEVTSLEVFNNIMNFELGQEDFFKNNKDMELIRIELDKETKCLEKSKIEEIEAVQYTLDKPLTYETTMINDLINFAWNLNDAYLLMKQNNPSNANLIFILANDANIFFNKAIEKAQIFLINPDIKVSDLMPKYLTKEQAKSIVWIEGCILRFINLSQQPQYNENNIGNIKMIDIFKRFSELWASRNATYSNFNIPRPNIEPDYSAKFKEF
jgi:hypothetical protein